MAGDTALDKVKALLFEMLDKQLTAFERDMAEIHEALGEVPEPETAATAVTACIRI